MGQRLDTCNLCTRYNPLSSDNNSARQLMLTKKELAVSLNIKITPSLIHCKWTIQLKKQKGKPREKTVNGMNRLLAQPQTLTQGSHEIASLLN